MVPAVKNDTSKKIKKIQKKQTSEHSKFKNNVPKRKPIPVVRPLHGKKHARTGRSGPPSTTNPAMDTAARKRRGSIEWALGSTARDTNGLRGKRGKRGARTHLQQDCQRTVPRTCTHFQDNMQKPLSQQLLPHQSLSQQSLSQQSIAQHFPTFFHPPHSKSPWTFAPTTNAYPGPTLFSPNVP
jgi:hypothetical protein